MAVNSLYPGFVRVIYQVQGREHTQTLPALPFLGIGDVWYVQVKGNPLGVVWTAAVDAYMAVFRPTVPTTGTVLRAELWTLATPTAPPLFREAYNIALAGLQAGAGIAMSQNTISFRSVSGGVMKWVTLECATALNVEAYPPFTGVYLTLSNWLLGANSFVVARDGGWLNGVIRFLTKTNDTVRKKYLLDA